MSDGNSTIIRATSTVFVEVAKRRPDTVSTPSVAVTLDRDVLGIEAFTAAEIEAIRRVKPTREADAFNYEC